MKTFWFHRRSSVLCGIALVLASELPASANNGGIRLYFDAAATQPADDLFDMAPFATKTVYAFAELAGVTLAGIAGTEFTIQVNSPNGALFQVETPQAQGAALAPNFGILFSSCQTGTGGRVLLTKIDLLAVSNVKNVSVTVEQADPIDPAIEGPALILCDNPVFTMVWAGNTPAGANVLVPVIPDVSVEFDQVDAEGHTTVSSAPCTGTLPANFQVPAGQLACYKIESSATFSGAVEVCMNYDATGMTQTQEDNLSIMHCTPACTPLPTTFRDTGNNRLCATTTSFSEFALAVRLITSSSDPAPSVALHRLHPARPNPFNPTTTIRFDLSTDTPVRLEVFDIAGRLIRLLVDAPDMAAGTHEAIWNGRDRNGRPVSTGLYLCRLRAGAFTASERLVLVQ